MDRDGLRRVRIALFATDDLAAVMVAAGLATSYDVITNHAGVAGGHWTYTDDLPGPRYRGAPWWNFAAWFVISSVTAGLAVPFL